MDQDMMQQLAELMGLKPVNLTRVEFSAATRSFIATADNGDGYGGDLTDTSLDVETVEARLTSDAKSGGLGRHFMIYEPVAPAVLAEKRAAATDWRDIFTA